MKTAKLTTILATACASVLVGANPAPSASQLLGIEKNIARQHLATNVLIFDAASSRYIATEAAATWLDDDITTAWAPLAGKQHYLVQFAQPQLIHNFEISGREVPGKITLYTGDSAAAPGDGAWASVATGIDYSAVNNKRLAKPINKFAKYLLIETDIAEPKSVYGIHVYGENAAVNYSIVQRPAPADISTIGEFVNNQTAFNLAGLYSKARVTYAGAGTDAVAWQNAIDDDPETSTNIAPGTTEAGVIVKFDAAHPISRLAFQGDLSTKGKLDVFLLSEAPEAGQTVNIEGVSPSATFTFDGTTDRISTDIPETTSVAMAIRWTPEGGTGSFALREVNAFGDLSLANYEVISTPVGIAKSAAQAAAEDQAGKEASDGKTLAPVASGKEVVDFKGGKESVPPVLLGPNGYRPGLVGFPPDFVVSQPEPPEPPKPPQPPDPISPQ